MDFAVPEDGTPVIADTLPTRHGNTARFIAGGMILTKEELSKEDFLKLDTRRLKYSLNGIDLGFMTGAEKLELQDKALNKTYAGADVEKAIDEIAQRPPLIADRERRQIGIKKEVVENAEKKGGRNAD